MLRRSLPTVALCLCSLIPLSAWAQTIGSATTAPIGQAAPALSVSMIGVLATLLIGFAVYRLRTRSVPRVALVAAIVACAGFVYAIPSNIVVQGADCNKVTTQNYDGDNGGSLTSHCPGPIQITALDACGNAQVACDQTAPDVAFVPVPACYVGLILNNNGACELPNCGC